MLGEPVSEDELEIRYALQASEGPHRLGAICMLVWQLATPHGDIDVLHEAPGAAPYGQLRERALLIALDDVQIAVAGRDDLIRMKLARGRPVDSADVAALTDAEAEQG